MCIRRAAETTERRGNGFRKTAIAASPPPSVAFFFFSEEERWKFRSSMVSRSRQHRESNFLMEKPTWNYFSARETSWAFPSTLLAHRATRAGGDLHRGWLSHPSSSALRTGVLSTRNITGSAGCARESPWNISRQLGDRGLDAISGGEFAEKWRI